MFELMITLTLSAKVFLFVVGSLAMFLALEQVVKSGKVLYAVPALVMFAMTLPLSLTMLGMNGLAVLAGLASALAVGFLATKLVQLSMIWTGIIQVEDVYPEES